jgi:hypothetical protein
MSSSTPEAPDPGTMTKEQLMRLIALTVSDHEEYHDIVIPEREQLIEALAIDLKRSLARQSPTVALTNDREEERER